VFAITRRALADLATTSLEACMGELFMRRLSAMDDPAKQTLGEALKSAPGPVAIRTAFDLPPEPRAAIQNALNVTFSADIPLQFETAPDLISGIELTANGQKVAWSLDDYLNSLQKSVDDLLKAQDAPKTNDAPEIAAPPPAAVAAPEAPSADSPQPGTPASETPVTEMPAAETKSP
jgi:F-type H+-transporting ATPase subunit b